MRLEGKTALITGGTSGIGRATVELFREEGAQVAFTGRRADRGRALSEATGALYILADHTVNADCQRSVTETVSAFGWLDVLVNNAGIVVSGTAETTSEADWQQTLALNVTGVWWMCKYAIPYLRMQGGAIINNASDWGLVGARNALAYAASKGAVVQMTRSMALDHAHEGIRVNAVCPGDTFVERWVEAGYFEGTGAVSEEEARQSDDIPLGRVAEAAEIARVVLFLASDESSFMTGTLVPVDGGNTAQ
jgi:meso-butanediol dehydrogenase/(S,S)-butanediol dehydrogenase/diacetyl reductase